MKFTAYALQFGDRGYLSKNQPNGSNSHEWSFTRKIEDAYLYKTQSGIEKKALQARTHSVYRLLNLSIVEVEVSMTITSQHQWTPPERRRIQVSSEPDPDLDESREKLMNIYGKKR